MSASAPPVVPAPGPKGGMADAGRGSAVAGPSVDGVRPARWVAWVGVAFVVAVTAVMVWGQWRQPQEEPWRSAELARARERLLQEPKNEALKAEIRQLDLKLRQAWFRGLDRNRTGAWLLAAGGVLLVLSLRAWLSPSAPVQPYVSRVAQRTHDIARARRVVWITGGVAGGLFCVLGTLALVNRPVKLAAAAGAEGSGAAEPAAVRVPGPAPEAIARNWPRFMGPDGTSRSASARLPLTWDVKTGSNVVWKTAIPVTGYNSPVVWDDRVYLTGGDKRQRLVYAFDARTGALVWQQPVTPPSAPAAAIEPPDQSGQAASTVTTDGERVYAVFATGELGALKRSGDLAWHARLDFSENGYGHASSLVLSRGLLLVQADQGRVEDGKSALYAFDAVTGQVRWSARRPVGGSWTTPVVTEVGGVAQVLAAGDPLLIAHALEDGRELWRASVLGGELAPSPVVVGDLVVVVSPGHAMSAVRLGGTGDVTATHVAWKEEEDIPDVPTPLVLGELMISASTEGHLVCRETATGALVWKHELEMEIQASPLGAGDRVYLFAQPGDVVVIRAGRQFEELARFGMDEEVYASPAVAGDDLVLRTRKSLYRLSAGGAGGGADGH